MLTAITKNEPQLIDQIASEMFALSPQMVEALNAGEGEKQFPRMFAHAYLRGLRTQMQMVNDIVPRMIRDEITKFRTEANRDSSFFQKFPKLTRTEHGSSIKAMASTLRALNPKMDEPTLLDKIGTAVMAMHGIASVPATTPSPAPQARVAQNGFVPAQAGRPADVRSQPAPDSNPWSGLWSED
jgi:hypothetical protein